MNKIEAWLELDKHREGSKFGDYKVHLTLSSLGNTPEHITIDFFFTKEEADFIVSAITEKNLRTTQ